MKNNPVIFRKTRQAGGHLMQEKPSLLMEFLRDQLVLILVIFFSGVLVSYFQYGFVPGTAAAFPVAGVNVSVFHLVFMGIFTGYVMGLVGEASGILSMPYSMSVIGFDSLALSPTSLITTFINPFGALMGYYRGNQWNLDFAKWLCLGAFFGAPFGPFIRVFWLQDPEPFKLVIGCVLFFMGFYLWVQVTPWYLKRTLKQRIFKEKFDAKMKENGGVGGLPDDFEIVTLKKSRTSLTIRYWGETQTFSIPLMFVIGFLVGIIAATLGVGGGFLLVPILVTCFGIPMYVLVAATVPFVITLSIAGLIAYVCITPMLTNSFTSPDWAFGLFVAAGALLGSWLAAKTQRFIPEKVLKPLLGTLTLVVGLLYIVSHFYTLPVRL